MKPSYPKFRRLFATGFSLYYTVFSVGAIAATKPAPAKKKAESGIEIPMVTDQKVLQRYRERVRWASPDPSLFPLSVTNPSSSVGNINTNPNSPFLIPPGITPLLNTNTISNNNNSVNTNMSSIDDPNGYPGEFPSQSTYRPTRGSMTTALVPAEFTCPLFDNNPYESIFRALESMRQAMLGIGEKCLPKEQTDQITSNADRLKDSVNYIRTYQTNPDLLKEATDTSIKNAVTTAVSSIDEITSRLSNNPLVNNSCNTSSLNKSIVAFNEVVSNLAPIALLVAAANPAVAMSTKSAIFGVTVASYTVSSFMNNIAGNSIDITNPDNEKAILQNTCQYLKVAKKVDYLKFRKEKIAADLNKKVYEHQTRYQSADLQAVPLIKYRYNSEKSFAEIETSLEQDEINFNYYNDMIKKLGTDHHSICYRGIGLAKVGRITDNSSLNSYSVYNYGNTTNLPAFPMSIIYNLDKVTEALQQSDQNAQNVQVQNNNFDNIFNQPAGANPGNSPATQLPGQPNPSTPPTDPNQQNPVAGNPAAGSAVGNLPPSNTQALVEADQYFNEFKQSRNKIINYIHLLNNPSKDEMKNEYVRQNCAKDTSLWLQRMKRMIDFTANLANAQRNEVLKQLENNEEYRVWAEEYKKLHAEKRILPAAVDVLAKLSLDTDGVSSLSTMISSVDRLKESLFIGSFMSGRAPVRIWLEDKLAKYNQALIDYKTGFEYLQSGLVSQLNKNKNYFRKAVGQARVSFSDLSGLTLENTPMDSEEHPRACQQINTNIMKLENAKVHLSAAKFMCNMIDEVLSDPSIDARILQICRGGRNYNATDSEIRKLRERLKQKGVYSKYFSISEIDMILKKKSKELSCPPAG